MDIKSLTPTDSPRIYFIVIKVIEAEIYKPSKVTGKLIIGGSPAGGVIIIFKKARPIQKKGFSLNLSQDLAIICEIENSIRDTTSL